METRNWWKAGLKSDIYATHSGSGTVSASVFDNKIYVNFDNLSNLEVINIYTPFDFKIVDAYQRIKSGKNQATKTLTIKNDTTALSDAMSMATDKAIVRATTIDSAEAEFSKGDNDLNLVSSDHGDADALVVISIEPV